MPVECAAWKCDHGHIHLLAERQVAAIQFADGGRDRPVVQIRNLGDRHASPHRVSRLEIRQRHAFHVEVDLGILLQCHVARAVSPQRECCQVFLGRGHFHVGSAHARYLHFHGCLVGGLTAP